MKLFTSVGFHLALILWAAATAAGQNSSNYTFESGLEGDGVTWPGDLSDAACLFPSDFPYDGELGICNETVGTIYFSQAYTAAADSVRIEGAALWGAPAPGVDDFPYLVLDFDAYFVEDDFGGLVEEVTTVSFDIALASSSVDADLSFLPIFISDYDGNTELEFLFLDEVFSHSLGAGDGFEGRISLAPTGSLANIYSIEIDLSVASNPDAVNEFAIDNLRINPASGPESNVFPVSFDDSELFGPIGANSIVGRGLWSLSLGVRNNGGSATEFTSTVTGDLTDPNPGAHSAVPINPGETVADGLAFSLDTDNNRSGTYRGTVAVSNDLNPADPDETIDLVFLAYDPADLNDNSSTTIDQESNNGITVSNAPPLAHAGALRASILVTEILISDPRFSVSGITVDDRLQPGESLGGTVAFDDGGVSPGTYSGTLTLRSRMSGATGSTLDGAPAVPDIVWNLSATVPAAPSSPEVVSFERDNQTNTTTISFVTVPDETFIISAGPAPDALVDLPNPPVGDGNVFHFQHNPPPGSLRYFYAIRRAEPPSIDP